jgi:photosystem II stability/assembly factor-like uncharacterized protein
LGKREASISGGTFHSDGSVYLIGVDGTVQRSTDEGKTFSVLPVRFPGGISLTDIDGGDLLLVGINGLIRIEEYTKHFQANLFNRKKEHH